LSDATTTRNGSAECRGRILEANINWGLAIALCKENCIIRAA
jgi:hypothetical protein